MKRSAGTGSREGETRARREGQGERDNLGSGYTMQNLGPEVKGRDPRVVWETMGENIVMAWRTSPRDPYCQNKEDPEWIMRLEEYCKESSRCGEYGGRPLYVGPMLVDVIYHQEFQRVIRALEYHSDGKP
jgi:hypothetical protein